MRASPRIMTWFLLRAEYRNVFSCGLSAGDIGTSVRPGGEGAAISVFSDGKAVYAGGVSGVGRAGALGYGVWRGGAAGRADHADDAVLGGDDERGWRADRGGVPCLCRDHT